MISGHLWIALAISKYFHKNNFSEIRQLSTPELCPQIILFVTERVARLDTLSLVWNVHEEKVCAKGKFESQFVWQYKGGAGRISHIWL